jgi:hypothetical protein
MEFEPQASECKNERFRTSRVLRSLVGKVPGYITLRPSSAVSRHAQAKPFDEGKQWGPMCGFALIDHVYSPDEPRVFRYIFGSTINQATLTRLRVKATRVWTRLILGADGF